MCLAIPGQVLEVVDEENRLAKVDVAGSSATSTSACSTGTETAPEPGDWVLIHVGFALSKVDEEEAQRDASPAPRHGRGLRAGARGPQGERDRVTDACAPTPTASPARTRAWRCGCRGGSRRARASAPETTERDDGHDRSRRRRSPTATSCWSTPARRSPGSRRPSREIRRRVPRRRARPRAGRRDRRRGRARAATTR